MATGSAETLTLFIDNERRFYDQKWNAQKALAKKKARGVYDSSRAPAIFAPVIEAAARALVSENHRNQWNADDGSAFPKEWHVAFPKRVRDEAAKEFTKEFENDLWPNQFKKEFGDQRKKISKTVSKKHPASGQWTRNLTLAELKKLPTISQGHTDNLKIDTGTARVWMSRMTVADGMPYNNQVTVEQKTPGGTWVTTRVYRPLGERASGERAARHEAGGNPRVAGGKVRDVELRRRMKRLIGGGGRGGN